RECERHALLLGFEERDLERIALSELEVLAELLWRLEFRDVDEARDAFLDRGERAVLVVFDDHTDDILALLVAVARGLPRILLERLHREGDLPFLDLDHLHFRAIADLEEGARIFDEAPVELADVDEAFKTLLELHEDAEIDDARHFAFDRIADLVLVDERCLLGILLARALGEYELTFARIRRDDADRERDADELLEFAEDLVLIAFRHARIVILGELGRGEEALDALPREDEAALVCLLDGEIVNGLRGDGLLGFAPDRRLARLLEGELDIALAARYLDDLRRDGVADVRLPKHVRSIKVFASVDETRAEGRKVDIEPAAAERDDFAFDQVSRRRRGRNGVQKRGHRMVGGKDDRRRGRYFFLFLHFEYAVLDFRRRV